MNDDFFTNLILSYGFQTLEYTGDEIDVLNYYEFKIEEPKEVHHLSIYCYKDDTFSLYRNEGFIKVKLSSNKMNIYNLRLSIEKSIPKKILKKVYNERGG